jgi:ABC-type sugar transport system, permease component
MSEKVFTVVNYSFLSLLVLSMIIPALNIISLSFSNEIEIIKSKFILLPKGFNLEAYKEIFKNRVLYQGLYNSSIILLIGVPSSVFVTVVSAYLLTCEGLIGARLLGKLLAFSMLFYPGIIPLYILYKKIGIMNTRAVLILPFLMLAYFLIYVKSYFHTIPASIHESAWIDGASRITVLFRIVLPLSKAIIAVLVLWYIVEYWNLYFYPMAFISNITKKTIQPIMRDIVMQTDNSEGASSGASVMLGKNMQMGVMVLSSIPPILAYIVLQKNLIKGILLGSVKG